MDYQKLNEEGETPNEPPPPYTAPPPGFNVPPQPPQGPTVACECCGFSISTSGVGPNTRLIQCTTCRQHTAIGPPPAGKKYLRCVCKKLLHCSVGASKVRCPGCKTVLNVSGGGVGGNLSIAVNQMAAAPALGTCRVVCANCNQVMLFRSSGIARCPHCRRASSVGPEAARWRFITYFVLAFIFLGSGIGVTVGTYAAASAHGGYYYVWSGAYISGLLFLLLGIRYAVIRVSYPENQIQA